MLMSESGLHTCCSSSCRLGHGRRESRRESPLQCLLHRYRSDHRLHWRDQVRSDRSPVPTWRHRLRSYETCHGATIAELR